MNESLIRKVKEAAREEFEGSGVEYHNFEHTQEFVEAAKKICEGEDVSGREKENVILAGWLHDVGAVEGYEGHEERSAEKAEAIFKDLDVLKERIEKIKDLIVHTDVSLEPENLLHEIMLDADAAFLAADDYFEKEERMYQEFKNQGKFEGTKKEFFKNSLPIIKTEYNTETARELFEEKRKENLKKLRKKAGK